MRGTAGKECAAGSTLEKPVGPIRTPFPHSCFVNPFPMAYDSLFADRMRDSLHRQGAEFDEEKMMGGIIFMVDEKMCCGTHLDKGSGENQMMARLGKIGVERESKKHPACSMMQLGGRPMRGFARITQAGVDTDDQLDYWIQRCLAHNPEAKRSKK